MFVMVVKSYDELFDEIKISVGCVSAAPFGIQ